MPLIPCPQCGATNRIPAERAGERARCGKCGAPLETETGPVDVSDASFAADVLQAPVPVLLDCWAPWCGPWHALAPVIEELAREYAGRVRVAKLNVDDHPRTAARFGIQGIPTLLLFTGGQLRDRLVGVQPKAAIRARLEALLAGR